MAIAATIGGMGVAGYLYLKNNKSMMNNMKSMVKSAAKKTYDMLDQNM